MCTYSEVPPEPPCLEWLADPVKTTGKVYLNEKFFFDSPVVFREEYPLPAFAILVFRFFVLQCLSCSVH